MEDYLTLIVSEDNADSVLNEFLDNNWETVSTRHLDSLGKTFITMKRKTGPSEGL